MSKEKTKNQTEDVFGIEDEDEEKEIKKAEEVEDVKLGEFYDNCKLQVKGNRLMVVIDFHHARDALKCGKGFLRVVKRIAAEEQEIKTSETVVDLI